MHHNPDYGLFSPSIIKTEAGAVSMNRPGATLYAVVILRPLWNGREIGPGGLHASCRRIDRRLTGRDIRKKFSGHAG